MPLDKHTFSFFYEGFSKLLVNKEVQLCDEQIVHRLKHVLRIQVGDQIILFDREEHGAFQITSFDGKKKCQGMLIEKQQNQSLKPYITFLLPLLKADALHDAIYSLAEVGVNEVQLVTTQKSVQKINDKQLLKLQKIVISAAEQCKQYAFSVVNSPISLVDAIQQRKGKKIYFDVSGARFAEWKDKIESDDAQPITLLVGPEGDLSSEEKDQVKQQGYFFCSLTQTVLRSIRAISLVSGLFRL